jgi:hypothetical protein
MDFFSTQNLQLIMLDQGLDISQHQDYHTYPLQAADAWQPDPSFDHHPPNISDYVTENDYTLSARYASMCVEKEETIIYDAHTTSLHVQLHEAEICRVLGTSFPFLLYQEGSDLRSSRELLLDIQEHSNFALEEIVRVMNKTQYTMHRAFAESYGVDTSRTTFHGTSLAAAALITSTGFKGAASQRALFGKGVYSSPDVWEALAYATPTSEAHQIVFVVDYLQGPHAEGVKDQIDFGVDHNGREILTLTNPEETILCASKEYQLLATYRMTVRYLCDRVFTKKHRDCVRVVHADIGRIIRQYNTVNLIPVTVPPPTTVVIDSHHHTFQIGDNVRVKSTLKAYVEFTNMTGVVKRIVRNKGYTYFFCVLLDCPLQRETVKTLNSLDVNMKRFSFLKQDEIELLCLKVGQIETHTNNHVTVTRNETLLGKRKTEFQGDDRV